MKTEWDPAKREKCTLRSFSSSRRAVRQNLEL